MNTGASLPRAQLDDHIPALLDAFERRLRLHTIKETAAFKEEGKGDASAHGLQRWQQGYDLREVTREWGRLQLCLADELEAYSSSNAEVDPDVMAIARRVWAELCTDGASESVARYFQLQQIEAKGHVNDLARALEQLRELERSRGELWRQAVHDLRGNVGVVMNVTAGLALQNAAIPLRDKFLPMLQKNVSSLHTLLEDAMDLARLQAGHEHREVKGFDAAIVLRELCERMQPMAEERGLFLKAEGPDTLPVEGDAVKAQRIAQNLLINALKYTPRGGVTVSWGDSRQNDAQRWMLCVTELAGFSRGPWRSDGGRIGGSHRGGTAGRRNSAHGRQRNTGPFSVGRAPGRPSDPSRARRRHWPVHRQAPVRVARRKHGNGLHSRRRHFPPHCLPENLRPCCAKVMAASPR